MRTDKFQLRLLSHSANLVQAAVDASSCEHAVEQLLRRPEAITTPRISQLSSLEQILRRPHPEVDLIDPSRCFQVPQLNDECLLVEFFAVATVPQIAFSNSSTLPVPPPHLLPPHQQQLHTETSMLPPPSHSPQTSTSVSLPETSVAASVNLDFARPQGTWPEAIPLPPKSDKPIWSLLSAGGGKKKYLPNSRKQLKTSSKRCAGVYICSSPECASRKRPGTKVSDNPPSRVCDACRKPMNLVNCEARWNVARTEEGQELVYHEGVHNHEPPPIRSYTSESIEFARETVKANPSITPAQFQVGFNTWDPTHPQHRAAAGDVHPKLTTSTACAEILKTARNLEGIDNPNGVSGRKKPHAVDLQRLGAIATSAPDTVGDIKLGNSIISITIQTTMMRTILNSSEEDLDVTRQLGRSGLVTDAHNTFFNGPFTLIQTVLFNDRASRWFPVLYTAISRETTEAYDRHFYAILETFDVRTNSIEDVAKRFLHVVDFSAAQNAGFVSAFSRYYAERRQQEKDRQDRRIEEENESQRTEQFTQELQIGRQMAHELIRGCQYHLDVNIRRAARSLRISDQDLEDFVRLTTRLFQSPSVKTFDERREGLLERWPTMEGWLEWWTAPRIARLIVKCSMKMSEADRDSVPKTSNAVEGAHSVVLRGSGGEKHAFEYGVERLVDIARSFDARERATHQGYAPKALALASVDPSERRPPKQNLTPSTYTNSGKPPQTVFRPAKLSQERQSTASGAKSKIPTPRRDPKELIVTLKVPSSTLPPPPVGSSEPSRLEQSLVGDDVVPKVITVGPNWYLMSCYLDSFLVIATFWLRTADGPFSLAAFTSSSASQTEEFRTVWRDLESYFDAARRISLDTSSPPASVNTSISILTACRDQVRTSIARVGLIDENPMKAMNAVMSDKLVRDRMSTDYLYQMSNHKTWWEYLHKAFASSEGDVPVELVLLFHSREFDVRLCTDGHLRVELSPVLRASIAFDAGLRAGFESVQQFLDAQLFGKGYDRGQLLRCHIVEDGIQKCHAPSAIIRRLESLPFFLSVSIDYLEPVEPPSRYFERSLVFVVKGVSYRWELVGWSKNVGKHYMAGVWTTNSDWTEFNSLADGGRASTSTPTRLPQVGTVRELAVFYRFSGTMEEWREFNKNHGGLSSFGGFDCPKDVLPPKTLEWLRLKRPLFDKIQAAVVIPSSTFFPGTDASLDFKESYLYARASQDIYYTIFEGTQLGNKIENPPNHHGGFCLQCNTGITATRRSTKTRRCILCGSSAHSHCLEIGFSDFWLCAACGTTGELAGTAGGKGKKAGLVQEIIDVDG